MTPADYKREREARGTQKQVADLLEVDTQTISRRERGEIAITREAWLALRSIRRPRASAKGTDPPSAGPPTP